MRWLPTTLILFSVGIICVIAETAGADPWDRFVSDQQIFEAQTIRCDFTKGVSANWGQKAKALAVAKNHKMFGLSQEKLTHFLKL